MSPNSMDEQLAELLANEPSAARADLMERIRRADPLLAGTAVVDVAERAWRRAHGLGPIAALLDDPTVTEVMVNGPGRVWLERGGYLIETDVELGRTDIDLLIERVLDPLGLRVDRLSPLVDGRLADGSRVHIAIPPLAIGGPFITIRRFSVMSLLLEDFGPVEVAGLLRTCVEQRRTIVVSGGTGAGKTTLLNAMACHFPRGERVVVLEDTTELQFSGDHVLRLEARSSNSEGVGEVTLRDLVRSSLRMRPDRIVVGEIRGAEALDLLLALNTGHSGSLTTCHANSCAAALDRLLTLAMLGDVDLPPAAVEHQLMSAVDVVVQVARRGNRRAVVEVAEVVTPTGSSRHRLRPVWRSTS